MAGGGGVPSLSAGHRPMVAGIKEIDGAPVGDGRAGPITRRLRALYTDYATAGGQG